MGEGSALRFLEGLSPSSIRLGLDRVETALRALGHPERSYPSVHVAGTNGKGSTCAFLSSCLVAQGLRVGLYTSPHLQRINERFRIDGVPIADDVLEQRIQEILAAYPALRDQPPPLTYFEVGTLVALWHFAQERVDVAVLETGLGGRLDATNVVRPEVSVITPISFDHMDYLGHTLAAIAGEKAGIIKPGVPVVIGRQEPEALAVLEARAEAAGAPVLRLDRDFALLPDGQGSLTFVLHRQDHLTKSSVEPDHLRGASTHSSGTLDGQADLTGGDRQVCLANLRPGLRGAHQLDNAATALAAVHVLARAAFPITEDAVRTGLASARWPGRLEELPNTHPLVVLDGAHNPAGAEALARSLDELYGSRRVHLVFGVLGDKDHRPMMRALFPRCASLHLTPVENPRTLLPAAYAEDARALCADVTLYDHAQQALRGATFRASNDDLVLCTGSLFLIGQVRSLAGSAPGP